MATAVFILNFSTIIIPLLPESGNLGIHAQQNSPLTLGDEGEGLCKNKRYVVLMKHGFTLQDFPET